jgi:signal transduction histidine kinase
MKALTDRFPAGDRQVAGRFCRGHTEADPAGAGDGTGETEADVESWVVLGDGRARSRLSQPVSIRGAVLRFAAASAVVLAAVMVIAVTVSQRAAKREAVADARVITDLTAVSVIQPALEDQILREDPAAIARLDHIVRGGLLQLPVVRVKLWTKDGRIVYSNEPRLIGQTYPLRADEARSLSGGQTEAEISDLRLPENRYEKGYGKLLEVYRPVTTPSGERLLYETYSRYDAATGRATEILKTFGSILFAALVVLELLQFPLVWSLIRRVRHSQDERQQLLASAVGASNDERRLIAADLHDGAVQDLAATALVLTGCRDRAVATARTDLAAPLEQAANGLREAVRGLRSMLVNIYPPNLRAAGLQAALEDLMSPLRARNVAVTVALPEGLELPPPVEALMYRVAQEGVRNVIRHAAARAAHLDVTVEDRCFVLHVRDDGTGFDPTILPDRSARGHVGLRGTSDLVAQAGGTLKIITRPGSGTCLRLELPRT